MRLLRNDPRVRGITLVGGETALTQELRAELSGHVRDLIGRTSMADLPRLAAESAVIVCGNSAWLHIAEAVDRPAVVLEGPIVPGFGFNARHPRSRRHEVTLPCRPCSKHGQGACDQTGDNYHACMTRINAAEVVHDVLALVGQEAR